ncbi:MAG: hypothetical protein V4696_01955, partial [Pseudomonadota bacterium]
AKAAADVVRYSWTPALAEGDGLASYVLTETGCVIDSDSLEDNSAVFFVSGGTAGAVSSIAASAITNDGETLTETLYLPIYGPSVTIENTGQDYCAFALRKVFGRASAPASAQADALERMNAMLLAWRAQGADVGATFPITGTTEILVPDEFVEGIRANLIIKVADRYGREVPPQVAIDAVRGLQLIKSRNLSDDRPGTVYY